MFQHKKSLGQHFLHDSEAVASIVAFAQVRPGDRVLEIGPGQGVLTEQLLARGCEVLAVEIDSRLLETLNTRFANEERFSLVHTDLLSSQLKKILSTRSWETQTYRVVANIPYYITAPLIRKLLTESPRPEDSTLLVQKEVAERLLGANNNRSVLSVMAEYYAEVTLGPVIKRSQFTPAPKVDSQVVRLIPRRAFDEEEDKQFFRLVRTGFASRRKTLINNLATLPEFSKGLLEECFVQTLGWSIQRRAQELSRDEWQRLQQALGTLSQQNQ